MGAGPMYTSNIHLLVLLSLERGQKFRKGMNIILVVLLTTTKNSAVKMNDMVQCCVKSEATVLQKPLTYLYSQT